MLVYKKLQNEIKRKIFHSIAVIYPILYIYIEKTLMILILTLLTMFTLILDIKRRSNSQIKNIIDLIFGCFMREKERVAVILSGMSYMMLGLLISALIFSKVIAILSWFVLIFADTSASLCGVAIGKMRNNDKSISGSAAFFLVAFITTILFSCILKSFYPTWGVILTCGITTILEHNSNTLNVNDNLIIPIIFGSSLSIINIISM